MNLQKLIASGALIDAGSNNAIVKTVTWDGKTFDVKIKRDMSAADFEYVIQAVGDLDSRMARRVHRFVVLEDGERIPYETALEFKTSLLVVLVNAINEVHKPDSGAKTVKKNSRRTKSSGTT